MKKIYILLLGIFLLAFCLRIYKLDQSPSGFHRDEAFLGYNAFSILKTGKDMNGIVFPLHLKSFLYTPAGYSYLSIPSILVFGLNEFSVRFPSAFFGALSVIPLYFLSTYVIKLKNTRESEKIGLIASFLLAITPWHINLSRTASVITVVTLLILVGILFSFIWAKRKNYIFLVLSFIFYGLSLMFYVAPYSFLPLFIPLLFIFLGIQKRTKKVIFVSLLAFFIIILLPLYLTLRSPELALRMKSISITNHDLAKLVTEEQIREDGVVQTRIIVARFFHNKPYNLMNEFVQNYLKHVSPDFLFSDKPFPERYQIPSSSLLFLFQLPLILIGVFMIIKRNLRFGYFLFAWIAIVPIGSAFTFDDVPNLQRTLTMLPAIIIISSVGLYFFVTWSKRIMPILIIIFVGTIILSMFFYLHQYYLHGKVYRPWYRQDGYKQLVEDVKGMEKSYDKVVVTNRESAPTIFFLFYSSYDPERFWNDTKNPNTQDFDRVNFANYEFSQEECPLRYDELTKKYTGISQVLYINSGLCKDFKRVEVLKRIYRKDNSEVFRIVQLSKY